MSYNLTHSFVKEQYRLRNIELLSPYTKATDPNNLRCLICEHMWESTYRNFKRGGGCHSCAHKSAADKRRYKHDDVAADYLSRNIELLSPYKRSKDSNYLLCLVCEHMWQSPYANLQNGHGCPSCAIKSVADKLSHNHDDVAARYLSLGIKLLSPYVNADTLNDLECLVCDCNWQSRYSVLDRGAGCPSCAIGGFKPDKPAFLYYLKLDTEAGTVYKIGICGADRLDKRMSEIHSDILFITAIHYATGKEAMMEEKRLHDKFAEFRIDRLEDARSGHTEFFSIDVLGRDKLDGQLSLIF